MSIVEARDLPHTERLNRDAALAGFAAQVVALATDVPARDIIGSNRRTAAVSRARQFAMYLAYVTFQWPLSRVGAAFGRDRTTAGYACRQIEDLYRRKGFYLAQVSPDEKALEESGILLLRVREGEQVQICFSDAGPGIPPQSLPYLFDRFYRVPGENTLKRSGTGLGLYICKKIVEAHRGQISVESQLGAGTTFFINLPAYQPAK